MKLILITAGVFAFLGVALGAIGAHAFKNILETTGKLAQYETAVQYQWYHTFALFALAGLLHLTGRAEFLYASYFMIAGILLFSGSLYAYSLTVTKVFAHITPFGGFGFLIGWGILIYGVIKSTLSH